MPSFGWWNSTPRVSPPRPAWFVHSHAPPGPRRRPPRSSRCCLRRGVQHSTCTPCDLWNGWYICSTSVTSVEIWEISWNPLKSIEIWWEICWNGWSCLELQTTRFCLDQLDSWRGWVNIQDWNPIEIDRSWSIWICLGPFWDHFEYSLGPHLPELTLLGSTYRTSGGLRVHGSGRHCLTARGIFDDAQACIQGLHWLIHSMFQINPKLRMNMNFWIPLVRMVAPKNKEYSL